jgi:hypothetical protein
MLGFQRHRLLRGIDDGSITNSLLAFQEVLLADEGANIVLGYGWYGTHDRSTRSKAVRKASYFSRCSRWFFNVFMYVPFIGNPDVIDLSYHRWIGIPGALLFPRFISYSITERAVSRGGRIVYGKTDLKGNMYLLSWRV